MKILACFANTLGFTSITSPTISYISHDTKYKAVPRFITMSTAQFFACMLKSDLNEDYKESPSINSGISSAFKYVLTDGMNNNQFSPLRLSLGVYSGLFSSTKPSINSYLNSTFEDSYHPKMLDFVLPILGETSEELIKCAATHTPCMEATLKAVKVGIAVGFASVTTFPLAKSIETSIDYYLSGDTVKIAHDEL